MENVFCYFCKKNLLVLVLLLCLGLLWLLCCDFHSAVPVFMVHQVIYNQNMFSLFSFLSLFL